jgi:hypothetical protein
LTGIAPDLPQIGLIYVPWTTAAAFKVDYAIGAEDRIQDENLMLSFAVGFWKPDPGSAGPTTAGRTAN